MRHFSYDEHGRLRAEAVDVGRLADAVGTPAFVYSEASIVEQYEAFARAFAGHPHLICYAMKANPSRAILTRLGMLGAGADIVSGGELSRALRAGIPPERIVFSGVGKSVDEMKLALDAGIHSFNVESEPELYALDLAARGCGKIAKISLRVNPDVDAKTHPYIATGLLESKFGIPLADAPRLASEAKSLAHVLLAGIDCHIGSQLTSIEPFLEALDSVIALVDRVTSEGHRIETIDIGGGLGISYKDEALPSIADFGAAILARMRGRRERILLEPGRAIVGNAGLLLTRVLYVKETSHRTFVITDAAMNDLVRPALYGAHHEIRPVHRQSDARRIVVDVVGPVCETGDWFARGREIDAVKAGDLLAIFSAGAYGFSMSSTYNSRPRAVEVMVSGAVHDVVQARESIESMTERETVPHWFHQVRR